MVGTPPNQAEWLLPPGRACLADGGQDADAESGGWAEGGSPLLHTIDTMSREVTHPRSDPNRGSNLSGSALWKVESCVEARAETRREICSVYREIRTRRGRKYPNTHRMFTLLMQSNGRVKS